MSYLFFALAGLFGANAVPHFVKGITGERHQSPFGKPSSAVVNVLWGTANGVGATLLVHRAMQKSHTFGGALVAITAGVLVIGVGLAFYWTDDDAGRGRD